MARANNRNNDRFNDDRVDAAGTVTVACRLPSGLVVPVAGHGDIKLNGLHSDALIVAEARGHHGITSGVPKDAWEALQEQYKDAKWLREGFVFAATKAKDATREARELGARDAGFNPLDPDAPAPGLQKAD